MWWHWKEVNSLLPLSQLIPLLPVWVPHISRSSLRFLLLFQLRLCLFSKLTFTLPGDALLKNQIELGRASDRSLTFLSVGFDDLLRPLGAASKASETAVPSRAGLRPRRAG